MTGASITLQDSVRLFNCYALSQTLGLMRRKQGIPILSKREKSRNGGYYSRYWLDKSYIAKVKQGEIKAYGA